MGNNTFNFDEIFKKLSSCNNLNILTSSINEVLSNHSNYFHVGKVILKSNLPSDFYSDELVEKMLTVYESMDGYSGDSPYLKSFIIPDNKGEITIIMYPISNYNFDLEDCKKLDLINELIYIFYSRLRYVDVIKDANFIDSLTSAPNLLGVTKFLGQIYANNLQSNYDCILLNLKNLKFYNNTYGMEIVNDLLREYFITINTLIDSNSEIIGRAGGDSFIAIINKSNTKSFLNKIEIVNLTICDGTSEKSIEFSFRAGIFRIGENDSINNIIEGASIALNISKEMRDFDIVYFNPNMLSNIIYEKKLLNLFPEACKNEEFVILYQPQVDLNSNSLAGAEALVRWYKDGKVIPPFQFVPVFEKGDCICDLDFYVLEQVCKDIRSWLDEGLEPVRVSINFSQQHLKRFSLAREILDILRKYNVDAEYIGIEFNEASNPEDYEALVDLVEILTKEGLIVSIDNFGKGFSSLNIVRNLKTDIKLDKSFIDMIEVGTEEDRRFLISLIQMLQSFDVNVIAEGVETEKQVMFLKKNNCHFIQGYFFDKPLDFDDFISRLKGVKYSY